MALTDKKYSAVHNKTGSDKDKLKANYDDGHINTFADLADDGTNPEFGALIYQIQEMQEELDYLRTEISANKDKTGITTSQANAITANTAKVTFPGLGTTNKTALAGDTTTISTAQANAITANTAKTTFPGLGTSSTTALAGDTKLVGIGAKTTLSFGDMVATTVKGKTTYTIALSVTTDFGGKTGSVTKSITLTLT
tara:strand:+ start:675 stop:1265 length:591 start_codon:yes stop_codon:yes gene_type:complete